MCAALSVGLGITEILEFLKVTQEKPKQNMLTFEVDDDSLGI